MHSSQLGERSLTAQPETRPTTPTLLALVGTVIALAAALTTVTEGSPDRTRSAVGESIVVRWNEATLAAVRGSKLGPPIVARALAIVHTCIFDAWAAYDDTAVGTRLGGQLRRPASERTLANKEEAVSFAAYRAAVDIFPELRGTFFNPLMGRLGYDVADTSTDPATPAGVGNAACQAVLDFRHRDGSNQLGDTPGGKPGVPYADYTGYRPVNAPMDVSKPLDPASIRDPNRWQPLTFVRGDGVTITPMFIAPHWGRVTPFALNDPLALRSPTGPVKVGTSDFAEQVRKVVKASAELTDRTKVIAEYWADGPHSELPPGHWSLFARWVAKRDGHGAGERGLDADTALFFALNNAVLDAGIVAWDNKVAFDSVRPITAVRHLLRGQQITAWGGPGRGTTQIDGSQWLPYQASSFPTPPFAEYSSGHSTFSAAGAEVLRLATGSDDFGLRVTVAKGTSRVEPGLAPAAPVTLQWSTFTAAAAEAGASRVFGGIHFDQANIEGLDDGKACGKAAWEATQRLLAGRPVAP